MAPTEQEDAAMRVEPMQNCYTKSPVAENAWGPSVHPKAPQYDKIHEFGGIERLPGGDQLLNRSPNRAYYKYYNE